VPRGVRGNGWWRPGKRVSHLDAGISSNENGKRGKRSSGSPRHGEKKRGGGVCSARKREGDVMHAGGKTPRKLKTEWVRKGPPAGFRRGRFVRKGGGNSAMKAAVLSCQTRKGEKNRSAPLRKGEVLGLLKKRHHERKDAADLAKEGGGPAIERKTKVNPGDTDLLLKEARGAGRGQPGRICAGRALSRLTFRRKRDQPDGRTSPGGEGENGCAYPKGVMEWEKSAL